MAWSKNGTPNTLTGTADDIDITDLTANTFNQFLFHTSDTSANNTTPDQTFNNNDNSVYAMRMETNGGTDTIQTSATFFDYATNIVVNGSPLSVQYVVSISGEEKLTITDQCWSATVGAGTAPERTQSVGKFVPSPDADITRIDLHNTAAGDYQIGDNLSALGSDGVESLNVQDGAVYYDKTLNKEYVLSNNIWTEL